MDTHRLTQFYSCQQNPMFREERGRSNQHGSPIREPVIRGQTHTARPRLPATSQLKPPALCTAESASVSLLFGCLPATAWLGHQGRAMQKLHRACRSKRGCSLSRPFVNVAVHHVSLALVVLLVRPRIPRVSAILHCEPLYEQAVRLYETDVLQMAQFSLLVMLAFRS